MAERPDQNLNTKEKSPQPFVGQASVNDHPSICTESSTPRDRNLLVIRSRLDTSFTTDCESDVSEDSGTGLDDSRLENLRVHCKCPCGSISFGHCTKNAPSKCVEARHSNTHRFPELNLCQGEEDAKIARREMRKYLASQTKNIRKIFATYFTAAYNWAKRIPEVRTSLRQTIRANKLPIESESFEWLFDTVTNEADFINYDVIRDHIMKPCRNASGEEEPQLREEAEAAEAKFMEAFKEFAQHRVFTEAGDLDMHLPIEEGVYKELMVKIEENIKVYTDESLPCLKKDIKEILNLPKQVILRVKSVHMGCVEVRFDVHDQIVDSISCLSLDQKRALLEKKITLLKYNYEVKYCCCQLWNDKVFRNIINDLYQAANQTAHQLVETDEKLKEHASDCLYIKGQTSKCAMVNCAYCGEAFGSCVYEYHEIICEMREQSSDDMCTSFSDSDESDCNRCTFKKKLYAFNHQTKDCGGIINGGSIIMEPSKIPSRETKRRHSTDSDTGIAAEKEAAGFEEITTKPLHGPLFPEEDISTNDGAFMEGAAVTKIQIEKKPAAAIDLEKRTIHMVCACSKNSSAETPHSIAMPIHNLPTTPVKDLQQASIEKISPSVFLEKYSQDFPIRIRVYRKYCGHNEESSISDCDQLDVHAHKITATVTVEDENGSRFNVLLNSADHFALLYNPHNNIREAMAGYKFDKVSDVLQMPFLPPLLFARRGFKGSDSSISPNELLIVQKLSKHLGKQRLKVYSLSARRYKTLGANNLGHFSTKPHYVRLYLIEILKHMPDLLPCKAVWFSSHKNTAQEKGTIPNLEPTVITMLHSSEKISLVATTVNDQDPKNTRVLAIPVDLDILVCVEGNVKQLDSDNVCQHVEKMSNQQKCQLDCGFSFGQECSYMNMTMFSILKESFHSRPPQPLPRMETETARPSKGESKNYSYVQVHLLPVNSAENIPNMRKAAQHSNQGGSSSSKNAANDSSVCSEQGGYLSKKEQQTQITSEKTSEESIQSNGYSYIDVHQRTTVVKCSDKHSLNDRGAAQPNDQSLILPNSTQDLTVSDMSSFGSAGSGGAYVISVPQSTSEKNKATQSQSPQTTSIDLQASQLEVLCKKFGLISENIDKEVSDDDILEIYHQLEKWEEVAIHLGLSQADIENIEGTAMRNVELKRCYMLRKWKSKGIAAGTAVTYRVLIQALLKCDCSSSASFVCELVTNVVKHK